MKLTRLIEFLPNHRYSGLEDFEVKGISCDSKKVAAGFIFAAIKGASADGNEYIKEAVENGARAIIIESSSRPVSRSEGKITFIAVKDARKALADLAVAFYGESSKKIKVVGITGTNGKTTVSYLIEAILKNQCRNPSVIGTINYRFNDKIIPSKNTTPGPVELQAIFSDMLNGAVDYCVMEVSSHALDQDRVRGISFHSAVFTNLTQDHLDYHINMENYFQAKAKLFKDLNPPAFAIINNDDAYVERLKPLISADMFTYGIRNKADVTAKDIKSGVSNTEFKLCTENKEIGIRTKLIGLHNVYNILASAAWANKEGVDLGVIKEAVEKFCCVPGRLERVNFREDFSVFVDYAHTEDALRNVIGSLRELTGNRIIVVFGCGGERDKLKRPKMGEVVSESADYAIITNDNPRSELPKDIIGDIIKGVRGDNYCVVLDRMQAIKKALAIACPGDVVLIAGKGHEDYQIFSDKILKFDDKETVRLCLGENRCLNSMKY